MSAFCRDGRPAPRGRGDSLPRPAFWGRGGSPPFREGGGFPPCPALPRQVPALVGAGAQRRDARGHQRGG